MCQQILPKNVALNQSTDRVLGKTPQTLIIGSPDAERQAEALLLLGEDLVGQEAAQRLLEEPAQLQALQLVARWAAAARNRPGVWSRNGKPTATPASCVLPHTLGRSASASV